MTAHDLTIAGYLAFTIPVAGLVLLSHRPGSRVPRFGVLMGRLMRTHSGRVGVFAGWAWLGLHFFAR